MKKKFLIIIVGQSIMILLMLMYSFVQQAEAEKQRALAELLLRDMTEMKMKAHTFENKYHELLEERHR